MQTAMRQLMEYVELNIDDNDFIKQEILEKIDQLIELEKEQIITDYSNGFLNGLGYKKEDKNIMYGVIMQSKAEGDIYYNETYNENK
jgi:uncharacterized protein YgfB (UPF0149 family)